MERATGAQQRFGDYARRDFVLTITNKRGAHTAPFVPKAYAALRDGSFHSIRHLRPDGSSIPVKGAWEATIRQIAHEAFSSIAGRYPKLLELPYYWLATRDGSARYEQVRFNPEKWPAFEVPPAQRVV